jgi:hypothetical protein
MVMPGVHNNYPKPEFSRLKNFKDTLNSILSSLHKIIGGILQKKGVLVKATYFSTNCNDDKMLN